MISLFGIFINAPLFQPFITWFISHEHDICYRKQELFEVM